MSTRAPGRTEKRWGPFDCIALVHQGPDRGLWQVRDARNGHTEILKLAPPEASKEARRALADEFLLLDRIHHPHWVRPIGFVHLDDGSSGYRMEDAGTPVSEGAGDSWLPRDLGSVRELLGALASLHALGYVHLDIKPSQLLQSPGGVKLIDPGLAAVEGSALPARGTWGFIAPEVLRDAPWDRRADFYALGCVLVEIWTGENPLGEGELADQLRRQRSRPRLRLRERVSDVPEGLDRVVETLLDPDPERRPRTAREVWTSLHTMAAYREGYAERRRLPQPLDLPLLGVEAAEVAWDRGLEGGGPGRWVITGPTGSGRRRLLERLSARSEVAGFSCESQPDAFVAVRKDPSSGASREVHCRVGSPARGEERIELGAVGDRAAAAALEAYGLEAEGDEATWTRTFLRLRLLERLGAEAERRRSGRERRAIATAVGGAIEDADRLRLGRLLARDASDPPVHGDSGEALVMCGLARVGSDGNLQAACPPWEEMSLSVVVGEETLAAAHRALLEHAGGRLVAGAFHALGCGDRATTLTHVLPAVAQLRDEGDLGRAFDLLARSRDLLAADWPASWAIEHASIALEDGTPARVMSLLGPTGPALPDAWRMLLEAHLQYRSGRRREAISAARAAQEQTGDTRVARAAEMIVIRSQNALGETEAAEAGARKLLEETTPDAPLIERLRPAALLLSILSSHGASEEACAPLRDLCARNLTRVGARERHELAASLGTEAFQRGDFAAAGTFMEIAVEAAATCHDPANLAIGQMNLAGVYFEEGRTAECEDLNGQALRACLAVGMEVQAAYAQRNLGTVMLATGRLGDALNLCRKAREVLGANPASPNALAALAVESETLLEAGLYESSRRSLSDAIDLLAANPIPMIATVIWRDMARLERWTGHPDRSADLLDEARRQAQECGASDDEARALIEMAALRIAGGDLCGGARLLDEAAPIVRASTSLELALRFDFARAMHCREENAQAAGDLLAAATARAARAHLAGWLWRCYAADAGIARSAGDGDRVLRSIYAARRTLLDLLDGIGPEPMRESYVMLCDSRLFLAWCDGDTGTREELPRGGSDLEVFLR